MSDKVHYFPASSFGPRFRSTADAGPVRGRRHRTRACHQIRSLIPRDAVITEKEQTYVRVKSGLGFEKRAVKIGPVSDVEAVVESGVEAGTVVLRS